MTPPKYQTHPLNRLFQASRMTPIDGMNWLQERGHISDECVWPEGVAQCDIEKIEAKFKARWGKSL